ncbi:MAG: Spermidine/putrescine transport system permease protein PotB [Alphaproteobacteria bacterium MarineAlpha5_Bin6]|nr:MAG: Spermidine/putrescine transport system permease protein PotB [Alphaproteobacteria bacterium MarineAlpha5_Bin7]PPR52983.1 MAG: Spermidine/putrescine transport system permease protein PotB [Alphaproteobacteria bacterium MarineAlpha5_Bin6]|tara:strand:+ start:104 stop:952 length:849 start_codon:yes stop_codon:yes gene_type:complete
MKSIINYFNTSIWTIISFLLVIVLILIPLASFLSYSFFTVEGVEIIHQFSLINYKEFFIDEIYINTFVRTIFLALFVMFCCILLGYPVAYFLARYAGKYKYAILLILIIPLFMSYIIKIYMMRSILGYSGLINKILKMLGIIEKPLEFFLWNQNSVIITLVIILLPLIIIPTFTSLDKIPSNIIEASFDLGCKPFQAFRHVIFPIGFPGLVVGGIFVFILALGDFVTPQLVGGTSGFTYGKIIYSNFGMAFNWPFGAALASILLFVSVFIISLTNYLTKKKS